MLYLATVQVAQILHHVMISNAKEPNNGQNFNICFRKPDTDKERESK
jgi:hypothetical protein